MRPSFLDNIVQGNLRVEAEAKAKADSEAAAAEEAAKPQRGRKAKEKKDEVADNAGDEAAQ